MQCPSCQRENELTNRFCIYCGGLLPVPEAEPPSEATLGPMDIIPQQVQALQEEARRLRELITLMNDRLATLERTQGVALPSPEPAAVTSAPDVVPTVSPWKFPLSSHYLLHRGGVHL